MCRFLKLCHAALASYKSSPSLPDTARAVLEHYQRHAAEILDYSFRLYPQGDSFFLDIIDRDTQQLRQVCQMPYWGSRLTSPLPFPFSRSRWCLSANASSFSSTQYVIVLPHLILSCLVLSLPSLYPSTSLLWPNF